MKTLNLIALVVLMAGKVHAADYFVAPTGNDANPGTPDKPLATLEKARDTVRQYKATNGGKLKEPVYVYLRAGTYVLSQTFELTPQDSGERGKPVRYMGFNGEIPIITSARAITGWKPYTEANPDITPAAKGRLWYADIPKGWRFHSLYVNGVPQKVIWHPTQGGSGPMTPEGTRLPASSFPKNIPVNGDVEVNFRPFMWWNSIGVITKKDGDKVVLSSTNPSWEPGTGSDFGIGSASLGNAICVLDTPNEWAVDSSAGRVYYWPSDGTMKEKTVTAPTLYELIRLQGDDLASRSNDWRVKYDEKGNRVEKQTPPLAVAGPSAFTQVVRFIEFTGLTLECTDRMPEHLWPAYWLKRQCENPDAALFVQGAEKCKIENCVIRHCGAYAMTLDHFAQLITVAGNEFYDLGSGGVQATGYGPGTLDVNGYHTIRRNHIHDIGHAYMHSAAVTLFGSSVNDVSLNWLANCPYAAVQICGTSDEALAWEQKPMADLSGNRTAQYQMRSHELPPTNAGRGPYDSEYVKPFQHISGNWVRRNVVHNYMSSLLDGGGLYCFSIGHGTLFSENLFKCFKPASGEHALAVHLDDWAGRVLVEDNVAWMPRRGSGIGIWGDNTHTSSPNSRGMGAMSVNTSPMPIQNGPTLSYWKNNSSSYPKKPEKFDDLFAMIKNDANAEGGWPKSVTPKMIDELILFDKLAVPLAVGTWVKAAEVGILNGPGFLDDTKESIGFCNGGGSFTFGPYRLAAGTIKGLEVIVGVQASGGKMHVRLDAADGPMIGTIVFQETGGWPVFKSQSFPVQAPAGDHSLYFVFEGGAGICNFKQFRFTSGADAASAPK